MSKKTAKHFVLAFSIVAIAALFCIACGDDAGKDAPAPDDTTEAVSNNLTPDEESVINEEFEAEAAKEIVEGNAEAKLAELEKEIDEDL